MGRSAHGGTAAAVPSAERADKRAMTGSLAPGESHQSPACPAFGATQIQKRIGARPVPGRSCREEHRSREPLVRLDANGTSAENRPRPLQLYGFGNSEQY